MIADLNLRGRLASVGVADEAPGDLVDGGGRVDDLVGGDAGHGAAEDDARGVAARLRGLQADRLEAAPDLGHVLDADPVVLDVLPVGDVGGVPGEVVAEVGEHAQLARGEGAAVDAHPQHEVLVVELVRLERGRCGRRRCRACAACRAPTSGSGRCRSWGGIEAKPSLA